MQAQAGRSPGKSQTGKEEGMANSTHCPTADDLRRFLVGDVADEEAAKLHDHLSECSTCLDGLARLSTEDSLVAAMREQARTPANPDEGVVQSLIARLAKPRQANGGPTATVSWDYSQSRIEAALPTVDGFEIESVLGKGGMGVVYKAVQTALGRFVALKMILDDASGVHIERFEKEARAVAALNDPHFVQIYEFGRANGKPYMALEYVEGGSLEQYRRGEPQSAEFAARTVETLARAMHKAHAAGLVHRDLKPHNVLLTRDRTPKIGDFGLVKRQDPDESNLTEQGIPMGTASYMAPEQTRSAHDVTAAADVYALGGILYCLLTGRPPFLAATSHDTILAVRNTEPVPPSRLRPDTPRDLEVICLACLEKEPQKRYATAADLADDLRRYLEGRPITRRAVSTVERAWRWSKRNPLGATVAALVAAIAVIAPVMSWRLSMLNTQLEAETTKANIEATNANIARGQQEEVRLIKTEQYNELLEAYRRIFYNADTLLRDTKRDVLVRKRLIEIAMDSLEKVRDLAERNTLFERDEAIGFQRLGDIYVVTGDLKQALERYNRAYAVTEKALRVDAGDARHIRNLAVICDKQAEVLERLGETLKAREKYREALEVRHQWNEKLQAQGKDHLFAKTAIAKSHYQLGSINLLLGEAETALVHLTQSQQLYGKAPENEVAAELRAVDYRFGEAHYQLGNADEAERVLMKVVSDSVALVKNQETDSNRRLLASARRELGDLYLCAKQDVLKAWRFYKLALAGYTLLWEKDRESALRRGYLANIEYRIGALLTRAQKAGVMLEGVPDGNDPRTHFERSCKLREELAKIDPDDMQAKIEWAVALARCGRAKEAEEQAQMLVDKGERDPRLLFQAACTFALASDTDDPEIKSRCHKRALEVLDKLIAAGWKDRAALRDDPDLDPLQGDPRFEELLKRLETRGVSEE